MLIPNFAFIYFSYEYFVVVVFHKVNKLVEIQNEPRDMLTNVNKGTVVFA